MEECRREIDVLAALKKTVEVLKTVYSSSTSIRREPMPTYIQLINGSPAERSVIYTFRPSRRDLPLEFEFDTGYPCRFYEFQSQ